MAADIAHLIIFPYLFFFGYAVDEISVAECHQAIEVQRQEWNSEESDVRK